MRICRQQQDATQRDLTVIPEIARKSRKMITALQRCRTSASYLSACIAAELQLTEAKKLYKRTRARKQPVSWG